MEFFIVEKNEVKDIVDKKHKMYLHEWGCIDHRESDFLDEVEEKINYVFHQELLHCAERAGDYQEWLENKELPLTVLDLANGKFMVCRNRCYYQTRDNRDICCGDDFNHELINAMNEVVRRNDTIDVNERSCALWILSKLGLKVKWKGAA